MRATTVWEALTEEVTYDVQYHLTDGESERSL